MNAIKRFGSAMIVPVLMFAFFGIVLGFATLFKNPTIMGSLADQHTFWFKILVSDRIWWLGYFYAYGSCICCRFTTFFS
ncbi:PTS system, arbutin-like IIBC component [Staphylococcus aureus]|uniref:PTS system, arbutin-like IIBC component n=1 Tax=Staphylococcus aureus TaxID=1280 RepID=A0A380DU30_STAAU|nr:PTS system, arbutin-like IIBC component [Staphylococcus aureus]